MILKDFIKDKMTSDEFIDTLIEKIPVLQDALTLNMDTNYENGKDNIDEAFAKLRFEVMLDTLNFLQEHKNKEITVEEIDDFIVKKILKI